MFFFILMWDLRIWEDIWNLFMLFEFWNLILNFYKERNEEVRVDYISISWLYRVCVCKLGFNVCLKYYFKNFGLFF